MLRNGGKQTVILRFKDVNLGQSRQTSRFVNDQ